MTEWKPCKYTKAVKQCDPNKPCAQHGCSDLRCFCVIEYGEDDDL